MKAKILAVLTVFIVFSCEIPENLPDNDENDKNIVFLSLTADGSPNITTTKLFLTFDKDIPGLDSDDIYYYDFRSESATGTKKGVLTRKSAGKYELSILTAEDVYIYENRKSTVSVSVDKLGYNIHTTDTDLWKYRSRYVDIYYYYDAPIPEELVAKWWISQALADSDDPGYFTEAYEITQDGKLILSTVDSGYTITVSGNIITIRSQFPDVPDETVTYGVSGTVLTLTSPSSMSAALQGGPFYKMERAVYGVYENLLEYSYDKITLAVTITSIVRNGNVLKTEIIIPAEIDGKTVTIIGEGAFYGASLTSITIPNSVTTIGRSAFYSNSLTSVTIPNSVTTIGWNAFANNNLTSVIIGANVTLGGRVFDLHDDGFLAAYNTNNKEAGTYTRPNAASTYWAKVN